MLNLKNRIKLFWMLNAAGWLLLNTIILVLYYRDRVTEIDSMTLLFITYFTGFWSSFFLRFFYLKINYRKLSIPYLLTSLVAASVVIGTFWLLIDNILSTPLNEGDFWGLPIQTYLSMVYSKSTLLFLWSALYVGINFWFDYRSSEVKVAKANELAQTAQLQMLRYQLNPHFLFNSLNSIRALIEEDKSRAKSMITELSEFLRYSLVSKNFKNVPLSNELEAIKHYFEIEKTRYEEKLEVTFDIEKSAENFPVLSFLLHPIIENAIKYGMKTTILPLKILIKAYVENENLYINIANTGKWVEEKNKDEFTTSNGTGTGLKNVQQRLENAFPDKHKFEIDTDENQVIVKIEIENPDEKE